jgi:hypothetical protein
MFRNEKRDFKEGGPRKTLKNTRYHERQAVLEDKEPNKEQTKGVFEELEKDSRTILFF